MGDDWQLAARARNAFADLVEPLSDEQLDKPTICGTWTSRQILGHLVFFVEMKMPRFMLGMAKAGFNYDKMADRAARANAERPVEELLSTLRAGAARSAPMPGFAERITVGDVAIHTQDVRRSLDLDGKLDDEVLTTALEFITTEKIGRGLADLPGRDSVTLVATDIDWSHGSGPEVAGTGEAILMGLAGRDVLDELSGEGVTTLRTG